VDNFYRDLEPFTDFQKVVQDELFRAVPDDWRLIITDIPGSTAAIAAGRYKDVNVIGATSIVGAINSAGGVAFPYVFGGDGATMAVPPSIESAIIESLKMCRWIAQNSFQMDLRIGSFIVGDLRRLGGEVKVAKFTLSSQVRLAMLRGDGLRMAEEKLKDPALATQLGAKYPAVKPRDEVFNGLECRWNPLKSQRGVTATIIAVATGEPAMVRATYSNILLAIDEIMGRESINPVSLPSLSVTVSPRLLKTEMKVHMATKGTYARTKFMVRAVLTMIVGYLSMKNNKPVGSFNPQKYLNEVVGNSDYRKFDNSLRMVLDCTSQQAASLREDLEKRRRKKELFYGISLSTEALMTCLVFNFDNHMHFIDGAEGGYATAAAEMKRQMASNS
jgi:hypothetical protein